jgi:hypothetical protein
MLKTGVLLAGTRVESVPDPKKIHGTGAGILGPAMTYHALQ